MGSPTRHGSAEVGDSQCPACSCKNYRGFCLESQAVRCKDGARAELGNKQLVAHIHSYVLTEPRNVAASPLSRYLSLPCFLHPPSPVFLLSLQSDRRSSLIKPGIALRCINTTRADPPNPTTGRIASPAGCSPIRLAPLQVPSPPCHGNICLVRGPLAIVHHYPVSRHHPRPCALCAQHRNHSVRRVDTAFLVTTPCGPIAGRHDSSVSFFYLSSLAHFCASCMCINNPSWPRRERHIVILIIERRLWPIFRSSACVLPSDRPMTRKACCAAARLLGLRLEFSFCLFRACPSSLLIDIACHPTSEAHAEPTPFRACARTHMLSPLAPPAFPSGTRTCIGILLLDLPLNSPRVDSLCRRYNGYLVVSLRGPVPLLDLGLRTRGQILNRSS